MDSGHGVAVDAAGNVLVTGEFYGTVDFGGGALTSAGVDVFVVKFDADGNHVWSRQFGSASANASGRQVAVDASDSVVVTGYFDGSIDFGGGVLTSAGAHDVFIAKLDGDGNHVWSRRFGDALGQDVNDVAVDVSGDVVVIGEFYGTVDFGGGALTSAGDLDIFVAKLDATGNHVWSKVVGSAGTQRGKGVAVDASGNVVLGGDFLNSLDFGGGPLSSAGGEDVFLAKLDAAGNHLWSRRYGDTFDQVATDVAVDATGNVVASGFFLGTADFGGGPLPPEPAGYDVFVAKLDGAGNHIWSDGFGDSESQFAFAVAVDASGDVVVTGALSGNIDFGGGLLASAGSTDIFVAKFDAVGGHVWSDHFGAAFASSAGQSVAMDGAGNALVTGDVEGAVDFGGGVLTGEETDIFVVKFEPNVGSGVHATPIGRSLMQSVPNPFSSVTTIPFGLERATDVSLRIYDASGRLVRVLAEGRHGAGPNTVRWSGDDESHRPVPSGVYFCRLRVGNETHTRKLVVLR